MLVIWALGSAIIWRLRRFHICATYVLSFLAFAILRAYLVGDPIVSEISPHHRPRVPALHLLHDHRPQDHRPLKDSASVIVVFCVAAVEMILRLNSSIYATPLRPLPRRPHRPPHRSLVDLPQAKITCNCLGRSKLQGGEGLPRSLCLRLMPHRCPARRFTHLSYCLP